MTVSKDIKQGDTVRISLSKYEWCEGVVISAQNYGNEKSPDWYIQLNITKTYSGLGLGYAYWKQSIDEGNVEHV